MLKLKNAIFFKKKKAKIPDVKIFKKSITSRNHTVIYHQTLEEAPWLLGLNKSKNRQKISKTLKKFEVFSKNCKNSQT